MLIQRTDVKLVVTFKTWQPPHFSLYVDWPNCSGDLTLVGSAGIALALSTEPGTTAGVVVAAGDVVPPVTIGLLELLTTEPELELVPPNPADGVDFLAQPQTNIIKA